MKLDGFIGAAYKLDSVNVDAQRCVNLYPEVIESRRGKEGRVLYLTGTPGTRKLIEVGDGPIRCIHIDSIGRHFVVSGNRLYKLTKREDWNLRIDPLSFDAVSLDGATDVDPTNDTFTSANHGYYTGLPVAATTTGDFPEPFSPAWGKTFYIIKVDDDTFKIATSLSLASAGTAFNITGDGSGTLTFTPLESVGCERIDYDSDIDLDNNSIRVVAGYFFSGQKVKVFSDGEMPGGLTLGSDYFVNSSFLDGVQYLQLSSSLSDLVDEAYIDISSISVADFYALEVGANGLDGGEETTFLSRSGIVKAASMSFGGDGSDSSTVFVDGKLNYLFKDDDGTTSFGPLSGDVQEATFDLTTDIKIYSYDSDQFSGFSLSISVQEAAALPTDSVKIVYGYSSHKKQARFSIYPNDGTHNGGTAVSITTEEFVEFINTGAISGKNVVLETDFQDSLDRLNASGGDSEDISDEVDAFDSVDFSSTTYSGVGYDSVPKATHIKWSDGFFIVNESGTNKFYVSDLQGFNISALNFSSSEGSPDLIQSLEVLHRDLYIFNEQSTEVYADTGNADFPFERVGGGFIEVGCVAANSVAKINGMLCWLGRSEDGAGMVYAIQGLTPQRISTHAIEREISTYSDISSATAYGYQQNGHFFYVLNFEETTWVYDFSTKLWHERAYSNAGTFERHRADVHAYSSKYKEHLVGDYESNKVYALREDVYDDDGNELVALRAAPHGSAGLNLVTYWKFQLDMETGIGLDGDVQGSNPTVMLDWSDDGGHTFKDEMQALADVGSGQIGDFKKRVQWRRLGSSRDRVFRVKISDPVKRKLIGAYIDVEVGAS